MSSSSDSDLGMHRAITRRDFLNGVSLAIGASVLRGGVLEEFDLPQVALEKGPNYYPPGLSGMRGSHVGSFETAHELAMNRKSWDVGAAADTGESYELVVVGAG